MMKNIVLAMSFAAMSLAMTSPARGALIFYEGFDYSPGAIHGKGGWDNLTGTVGVSATGLTYPNLDVTGGSSIATAVGGGSTGADLGDIPGVGALFNSTNSVFYMSLLVGDTSGVGASAHANLWIQRNEGAGLLDDGVYIDTTGGATPRVNIHQLGSGESGTAADATAGTKLYAIRVTMQAGADDVAFILNPDLTTLVDSDFDLASTGTASGELSTAGADLDWMTIYFGGGGQSPPTMLDEIRVGTTLADVTPYLIPEPASVTLLGLGGLMMLRRRRA